MRFALQILILVIIAFTFSCEEEPFFVTCSECTTGIPDKAEITIKLENVQFNASVIVNVYQGNLEDNILFMSIKTPSHETTVSVPVNKKYTFTADYVIGDAVYIAVDSTYPRIGHDDEQCENPCYYIYDATVNLKLKYE